MRTDCLPFICRSRKDLVHHRPNLLLYLKCEPSLHIKGSWAAFAVLVLLPAAEHDSSTQILQDNLGEIALGPCLQTGKSPSDGHSLCRNSA
jgi:hypothetical protein